MTVRNGRQFLSIPGPTTVPEEVLAAMHRPAMDIYGDEMIGITESSLEDLKKIFRTRHRTYIYIGNGHAAWEATLANLLSPGDAVLVLKSGRFAAGWGEMATFMGLRAETLAGDQRRAVDPAMLEARLREDREGSIKAILVVQIDTASGVVNDIPALRRAIDAAGHDALLLVDAIASLATMPFEMDDWGVDVAVTCSQKGLMLPPGLSFAAAGEKALAVHETAGLRTRYWDWTERQGEEHYKKYCGTAPVHMLFGLRQSLDMLLDEGLENVWERHRLLAGAVHAAVSTWSETGPLEFNITEPAERAPAVTTILTNGGFEPSALTEYCREKCGVTLGIGIGEWSGKAFRIAHMGHVNAPMVLGTLGVTEAGLAALGVPHGRGGVQAAAEYLGREVRP